MKRRKRGASKLRWSHLLPWLPFTLRAAWDLAHWIACWPLS
jgi:hypothetical protein